MKITYTFPDQGLTDDQRKIISAAVELLEIVRTQTEVSTHTSQASNSVYGKMVEGVLPQ